MTSSTAPDQPMHLDVTYTPGITVYGSGPARLQWSADNRLSLTTVEGTKEAPVYKELFNIPVQEVLHVSSVLDQLKITTHQGVFRMSVAQYAGPITATGGAAGMVFANEMYKKTGTTQWLERFRQQGVSVRRIGFGPIIGIGVGIALIIIAICAILAIALD